MECLETFHHCRAPQRTCLVLVPAIFNDRMQKLGHHRASVLGHALLLQQFCCGTVRPLYIRRTHYRKTSTKLEVHNYLCKWRWLSSFRIPRNDTVKRNCVVSLRQSRAKFVWLFVGIYRAIYFISYWTRYLVNFVLISRILYAIAFLLLFIISNKAGIPRDQFSS